MIRILSRSAVLAKCAGRHWISDNATTNGASLAFFCAFSIAPLLVIVLTTSGWIVGATAAYSQIGAQLSALFGPAVARILLDAIKNSQQMQGIVATVVSVVTLLIGATTVLSALQTLLQQIWKSEALASVGVRGWIRSRLLSLGFILALGFLLLVSLTLSTGLSALRRHIGIQNSAAVGMLGAVDVLLSVSLVALLFACKATSLESRGDWRLHHGGVVRHRPLGGWPVPGAFDAAECVRCGGFIRDPASMVVLHLAHISLRRRIHRLSRWASTRRGSRRRMNNGTRII
jgi:uncharacterized BrkB/YihY/UPF0761 family membrane protein